MASPDKEARFIVTSVKASGSGDPIEMVISQGNNPEAAATDAEIRAKESQGATFTVYMAIADYRTGEIPVERTAYRQRPVKGKAGDGE